MGVGDENATGAKLIINADFITSGHKETLRAAL